MPKDDFIMQCKQIIEILKQKFFIAKFNYCADDRAEAID